MPPESSISERPRISSNQLGEFVFATLAQKIRILRAQKFPDNIAPPYYQPAQDAILRAFDSGVFDLGSLAVDHSEIGGREAKTRNQAARWANNAAMVERFMELEPLARPLAGDHNVVRRNELLELEGVTISVRPEIVTRQSDGTFSYTKFRFSKSKVAVDASEIVLLLLLKFGQARSGNGLQIDPQHTKLVDCFARNVILGHALPRVREQQLTAALRQVVALWPTIRPTDDPLNGLQFAG
jgi:hypothetical protein